MRKPKPMPEIEAVARVLEFETDIVAHKQVRDAIATIGGVRMRSTVRDNAGTKARALLVVGDSGAGKTTVLEQYLASVGYDGDPVPSRDGDTMPILHIEMPSKPTRRQTVAALVNELGFHVREEWNTANILDRIAYFFEEMKVEIVLIDEAHHIMEAKAEGEEDISEFLKSLLNRSKAQFALFGLPTLLRLNSYSQLKRRLEPPVVLLPYHWDEVESRSEFTAVLINFESGMNLPEPSNLAEQWNTLRLYCATGGHIGLVSKYLSEAFRRALLEGRTKIDMNLLAEVYTDFERGSEQPPLNDNYLAAPLVAIPRMDAANNPFLADKENFDRLWKIMGSKRVNMSLPVKKRELDKTRLKGTKEKPKAFKE